MGGQVDRRRVARLYQRAGFGATLAQIDQAASNGYAATVDQLLSFPAAPPAGQQSDVLIQEASESGATDTSSSARWWLAKMASTSNPVEEKLTLYWHGHFASNFRKVEDMQMLLRQNGLLRSFAGGNFRKLCKAITADQAMLVFLDGATNEVDKPNENYGREFMELFTLGRGRYTQTDVKEAARAFTGYGADGQFYSYRHDGRRKTLLGQTGNWGPNDVADIVLDRHPQGPVAARHVATRVARFFHHPSPERPVVDAMAAAFVGSGYEIKPMMRALFLRPEFMDGPTLTTKSPVEVVAGVIKALGLDANDATWAGWATAMGQELFDPPSVAGWTGGRGWANTATTLARYNFAAAAAQSALDNLTTATDMALAGQRRDEVGPWMQRLGLLSLLGSTQSAVAEYLQFAKSQDYDEASAGRGLLTLLLASPDMNLR